ncbi:MAG TPA: SAM-dependent methyltransferase [Pyrinomonadaceae bacterium]|nr:SAM-dependent methyltransferase [Pyrinomonadaceae bacterium]
MKDGEGETQRTSLLVERLRERVRREGALTFRDWMQSALYDEDEGYYQRADLARWGRAGDYRTSPETSPLFAATFARYFAELSRTHEHAPDPFIIVEAGAGAGHFAHGVLSTLARDDEPLFARLRYVVDEASRSARDAVGKRLADFSDKVCFARLSDLDAKMRASVLFANELLDALPVHRVGVRAGNFVELCVGLDEAGGFKWVEREPSTPRLAEHFERAGVRLAEGQTAEVNLDAEEWMRRAASVLRPGGHLVAVDYGAEAASLYTVPERREGTLRGFSRHALVEDVLGAPGLVDLTTTVDWTQIKSAGERAGLQTVSLERQDAFLLRHGLLAQLERETLRARDEAERMSLRLGAREMILPGGMSEHFQVLVQKKRDGAD